MAVTLTEAAVRHVTRYLARRGKGVGVRLGVKTTGCSGLAYKLEYADDVAPAILRAPGNRAHQPELAPAINQPDAARGQCRADIIGKLDIARVFGRGRTAINGETFHAFAFTARSSSIKPAVAFALPTTPGMPAPGCVPAPTR